MKNCGKGEGNMIYFLGFIGAAVFYVSKAATFWAGVVGLLKAMVWPALLVYHVFMFIVK